MTIPIPHPAEPRTETLPIDTTFQADALCTFMEALKGERQRESVSLRVRGRDIRLNAGQVAVLYQALASVVPSGMLLTTGEAAKVLNVSRSYMGKLLDKGAIPCRTVPGSTHRRVSLDDVVAFKRHQDSEAEAALDEMLEIGEDLGLYMKALREANR